MRVQNNKLTAFGKLVVKALTDQDMSKADLAAQIGTSPVYLSRLLYGVRSGEKYIPAIIVMEVTAEKTSIYTKTQSLAERINDHLAVTKTSIAALAAEIPGYSRTTISRYVVKHAVVPEIRNTDKYESVIHVEGYACVATGVNSHAEGENTIASGPSSHAEGENTVASSHYAHAEGKNTVASGTNSHAEGEDTVASGTHSHAEGRGTIANNGCSHAGGYYNKEMTTSGGVIRVGDAFVIGNGADKESRSNAFRVTFQGTVYGTGAFQTSGADYAEFFEWADENPEGQDRIGRFVTLDGGKIKVAEPGDYILGIISGNPCIVGNADEDWLGRWIHDDFGRFVKEYLEEVETEIQLPDELANDELPRWMMENRVKERDGKYIQTTIVVVDHETSSWQYKASPDYDHTKPYIERKDRQEWDYVGMIGVLAVWDDGTCQVNGFCKVATGGIATAADGYIPGLTYRVIERVADNIIKVVFR